MPEHSIIFRSEMINAILEGRKTQTRRVVRKIPCQCGEWLPYEMSNTTTEGWQTTGPSGKWTCECCLDKPVRSPYGQPGDRLWVRETWKIASFWEGMPMDFQYKADGAICEENPKGEFAPNYDEWFERVNWNAEKYLKKINCEQDEEGNFVWSTDKSPLPWQASIFMPRWASRITLEIVSVRVERLQEISELDAIAEGCKFTGNTRSATSNFSAIWNSINFKRGYSWESNPWVWVIEFKRVEI